mgnify:FL=1
MTKKGEIMDSIRAKTAAINRMYALFENKGR